jgi:hypothetical protein
MRFISLRGDIKTTWRTETGQKPLAPPGNNNIVHAPPPLAGESFGAATAAFFSPEPGIKTDLLNAND